MSDEKALSDQSISLVNLGPLSKPMNTLIVKVSSAIGGLCEPWQITRVAKAEAKASVIKANSEIEITDLRRRSVHRFIEEEAKRQENMEEITRKALPHLAEESNPQNMEDDWVTNFFDKSRIVSDEEMQGIWAQVLAGEANTPGSFSKRTVNLLGDLDKRDAELFQNLCRFGWDFGKFTPLVFDTQEKIYNDLGIDFESLSHLDSLGLIQLNAMTGFSRHQLPKNFAVAYCEEILTLTTSKETENKISIGKVLLTQAGQELARVVKVPGVDGFYDYVKEKWKKHILSEETA
ncbi:MAG: DUF2806 domain-containing protein [Alphaproteobacteria bacterium]|nr:DUF2806 domain-containing protein [Alphaproteobacteria bacterium]MBP7759694.1 DUF2806 domain-containing protein [Alphaproteobacteria bacterium]MBP7762857.1 DUF2806 domain-containing protein [Alphaproteobacteria bacterium]MBP7905056.1 DUF2806 domain-containing protein [Alphaproteobacteria bacterium]